MILFNSILFLRLCFLVLFFVSLGSFYFEYFMGLEPCKLCLYQRYLWLISTIFLLFLNLYKRIHIRKKLYLVLILLTLISILSVYHSGIEAGYFSNIMTCSSSLGLDATNVQELDQILRTTENNDCAFPKFYFLGFSLANLGAIVSLFLVFYCLINIKYEINNKYEKK